jgi:hypothetical protein
MDRKGDFPAVEQPKKVTIQQHPTESALTSAYKQTGKHSITIGYLEQLVFSFKIEACEKKYPRHIINIGVYAYLRGYFFEHNEEIGRKGNYTRYPIVIQPACTHLEH